jgi:high-affinity nickel permease
MPMYMHTNCLLFASCNKLLYNSTFDHLKSLITLPIGMIRILGVPKAALKLHQYVVQTRLKLHGDYHAETVF